MAKYSFLKGFKKGLIAALVFSLPLFIDAFPQWANLTLGGALMMALNFFKFKNAQALDRTSL